MTREVPRYDSGTDGASAEALRPKIALIVDVPDRDLAGLVLTAFELCQRGATCYLIPASPKEPEIWSIQPDFVLLNYFRKGNDDLARRLVQAGISIGVLDTEGIWPTLESYTELLWSEAELRSQIRCACMWGTKLTEYVVREQVLGRDQVAITGCPRFDFYHPIWRSVLAEDDDLGTSGRPPRILFNTTCYFSNPRFTVKGKIAGELKRLFGWDRPTVERILAIQEEALESGIQMIRRLARAFGNAEIVVRPHPYEGPELYKDRLGDVANVRVNGGGPVQTQITRASVVIQRSCTTGIEATLANVPTLSPTWIPTAFEMPMAEAVSMACASYEELERTVRRVLEGDGNRRAEEAARTAEEVIREWFYRVDGIGYSRVSEAILRSLERPSEVDRRFSTRCLYGLESVDRSVLTKLARRVRYLLNLPPDWSFRSMRASPAEHWSKTDQFFDATAVRHLAERIRTCRSHQGLAAGSVEVRRVRRGQDHRFGYQNYSVRLACNE